MKPRAFAFLMALAVVCAPCPARGAALHVWQDSPNPSPPYGDWATAAHVIQEAVDVAGDGDTVLVTNGVYATGGRAVYGIMTNRVVINKAIRVESVNGPQATVISGAAASGGGNGNGAIRCVYLGTNAILSGFTLTNGHTTRTWDDESGWSGGGVWCEVPGVVTNCVLTGNSAYTRGGGAYGGTFYSCTLTDNEAHMGGGASGDPWGVPCTLYNCTLTGNQATHAGGGAYRGALYNCTLTGNTAWWASGAAGGGAYDSTLENCTLTSNSAFNGGGVSRSTLYNCVLSQNLALETFDSGSGGGALGGTLYNCTLWANTAAVGGGAYESTLYNCILDDNTARTGPNHSAASLHYSCTTPLPDSGVGNITSEPAFLNAASGNFRLAPGSPCIDAGTDPSGIVTKDLDGKSRPIDGDGDGVAAYDMGAYEYGVALAIALANADNQVVLSWVAAPGETYALEETPSLTPPTWTPSRSGSLNPVTVEVSGQQKFWRFRRVPSNMVWVPPGTFVMGSPETEAERYSWEGPQTVVTLTRGFLVGKCEVTQAEYVDVMGANPSLFRNGTTPPYGGSGGAVSNELRHPVEQVSWDDATNYCALLTERERLAGRLPEGWAYRLPTEAEWEYACRGGTTSAFHYGPALRSGMANFWGQSEYDSSVGTTPNPAGIWIGRTSEVGSYQANGWGLYDMHGNVGEWCLDWWSVALPGGRVTDPQGASAGSYRVLRGGSWNSNVGYCRSAFRDSFYPVLGLGSMGFRVVLAPAQ